MKQGPYLAEVFPLPPLVAYKRQPNIRDKLVRAKVPEDGSQRPKREIVGLKNCLNCPFCPFVQPTALPAKNIQSSMLDGRTGAYRRYFLNIGGIPPTNI